MNSHEFHFPFFDEVGGQPMRIFRNLYPKGISFLWADKLPNSALNAFFLLLVILTLSGCGAAIPERPGAGRHLTPPQPAAALIPGIVDKAPPVVLPPEPEKKPERYSVVVYDVPVRELLFAMARDASLNIDVHPDISGNITLNAINQTLPQILSRIARQVDLRWELQPPNLIIEPDRPVFRTYRIDYVNMARRSTGKVSVSTSIAGTGGGSGGGGSEGGGSEGGNDSTTSLTQESRNAFWATLVSNLTAIINGTSDTATSAGGGGAGAEGAPAAGEATAAGTQTGPSSIVANPESGLLAIRATTRQHAEIQQFIDQLLTRSLRQVLIEATVVEVKLSDRYQAGVDWSALASGDRLSLTQGLTGVNLASAPVTTLTLGRSTSDITATIKLLDRFGDLKVLSSPKVMVLNNQTAMLKVVDNKVHFTIEVTTTPATDSSPAITTYETTAHTVPVGFVMAVTPQISESEQVTLNVRPTISRIIGYVNDPSPALALVNVISQVPEIQVREVESILKVNSGQIAVLGGLMQDSLDKSTAGVPWLSGLPKVGNLFSYRDDTASKTELIIFLRPVVIRQASIDGDLNSFRDFLPTANHDLSHSVDLLPELRRPADKSNVN